MHILVRRDHFNITPDGILHKPTDARFVPSLGDRCKGRFCQGDLYASRRDGNAYDVEEVKKVMLQLWTEYVTESLSADGAQGRRDAPKSSSKA